MKDTNKSGRPECDIEQTAVVDSLFQTPGESRDEAWQELFLNAVPTASFACGDPQVLLGPDGFPYFALYTPEPGQPFESFCISNLTDDYLLESGIGVAINPSNAGVDWVFSYGDILNRHLNGLFYVPSPQTQGSGEEKQGPVLIAQPSESLLPLPARAVLRKFLQNSGIAHPMVFLVDQASEANTLPSLVFNIFEEDFETADAFNQTMSRLQWFLPRHYSLSSVPRDPEWLGYFDDL